MNAQYYLDHIKGKNIKSSEYSNGRKKVRVTAIGNDGIFQYQEWRLDGSIKLEGSFLNEDNFNYRNGTWTFWYKNGVVRANVDYSYDFKVGSTTVYNQDGSIQKFEKFRSKTNVKPFYLTEGYSIGNDNPANHPPEDGVWRYDGPFVCIEAHYVNWEKGGAYREWTSGNGKLLVEGFYMKDKKHGLWTNYHQSAKDYDNSTGIPSIEHTYINGERNGQMRKYYPSGQLEIEGEFYGEHKVGNWIYYDVDGIVIDSLNCNIIRCNEL